MGKVVEDQNAVRCTFNRKTLELHIELGDKQVTVNCIKPSQPFFDWLYGGPTPLGNYLIDKKRIHPTHNIDWFNLHQELPDKTGYYGYKNENENSIFTRDKFGLHPGTISLGCITVKKDEWNNAVKLLEAGDLTYDDLQEIQIDQSPFKTEILLTLGDIFGIGDRLSDIEKFIHDPQTLKRLEDFSYDFLAPSAKAKIDSLFEKKCKERENYLYSGKRGLLGIYNWLECLYNTKKKREMHKQGHSKHHIPKDASMNDITADDSLPTAALEERMTNKANFENARMTLKMIETELENESNLKIDIDHDRIIKLANLMAILFDYEDDLLKFRDFLSNNKAFVEKARGLRKGIVPKEKIDAVRVILLDPDLRMTLLDEVCPGSGLFIMWVNAFINYWVLLQFLETGEMSLSEKAEKDARRQESLIIRTHSCLLDDVDKPERTTSRELKNPSIEDLL